VAHDGDSAVSPLTPPQTSRRNRRISGAFLAFILAAHFLFLLSRAPRAIVSVDGNGYWAQGSLLAVTGRTWFERQSPVQFVEVRWVPTESGRYYSIYAPGLPVVVGLVYKLFGHRACALINPVLGTLSLLGLYFLVRRFLEPAWAIGGVLVLVLNPIFNGVSLSYVSHMAVTACLVWGVYFLLRWSADRRLRDVFAAGLIFGAIPAIHYPEAVCALGIGVFLMGHSRTSRRAWLHCLAAVVGAAIPVVALLIRNHVAFGAFWRTGYHLGYGVPIFAWNHLERNLLGYARRIPQGIGIFCVLGAVGMAFMCVDRRSRRLGWLLVLVAAPITVMYVFFFGRAAAARLLPTYICYVVGGCWILARVTSRLSAPIRWCIWAVVLVLQAAWGGGWGLLMQHNETMQYLREIPARVADALEDTSQPGDVIIAEPQVLRHLDFVRKWRLVDSTLIGLDPQLYRFLRRKQDRDPPSQVQLEDRSARFAREYGAMPPDEREHALAREIRRWADGHEVYYVGTERQLNRMHGPEFNSGRFRIVARVPLPRPPDADEPLRKGPPRTFHYLRNEEKLVIALWVDSPMPAAHESGG